MRGAAAKRATAHPAPRRPKATETHHRTRHRHPTGHQALHLLGSVWVASCPTCGYQLTNARTQERYERRARHRACPVCRDVT
jgi:NAD-dependent SIR2 family protein deacetylase